jgi:hypothetical protein
MVEYKSAAEGSCALSFFFNVVAELTTMANASGRTTSAEDQADKAFRPTVRRGRASL